MSNQIMRVIIYIRVSTKIQEKKFSLEGQRIELTRYAESMGWSIVATYQDNESGNKLDKEGLNALLDDVEDDKTDVVLVFDQDRLSRLDTLEWEFLKDVLRKNKVKIAEPGRITDLTNDDDVFFSDLKNLIAQRERKSVVRRMMNGKKQRMREGKGYGKAPFGYIFNKATEKYEVDEEWAWTIEFIDNMYLNDQVGLTAIADRLNEICRTPTGKHWNDTLIMRRLRSKAFHGVMEKTFKDGETISIENIYPPLRTKETYDEIQKQRAKRSNTFKPTSVKNNDLHLFRRTYFSCAECGRKIAVEQNGAGDNKNFYLKHGRRMRLKDRTRCDMGVNTLRLEDNVRKALKEIISGESLANKYIEFERKQKDAENVKVQIKSIERTLNKTKLQADRLLDLYLDDKLKKDKYLERNSESEELIITLEKQLKDINAKNELLLSNEWGYKMIAQVFEVAQNFDTELSPFEQSNIFGNLFPNGVLHNDKLVLILEIAGAPIEITVPIAPDPFPNHSTKRDKPIPALT